MAKPTAQKQAIEAIPAPVDPVAIATDINLEDAIAPDIDLESAIADQLLDAVDWQKVKQALLKKAPARLFKWFQAQILPSDGSPMITNEIEAMAISEGTADA
jgi:hypothetical protein